MRQELAQIDTSHDLCVFRKETGDFLINSRAFGGDFPRRIEVKSARTGNIVAFQPIGPDHAKFCHDGWDGEMQVYEPVSAVRGVTTLTVHHG